MPRVVVLRCDTLLCLCCRRVSCCREWIFLSFFGSNLSCLSWVCYLCALCECRLASNQVLSSHFRHLHTQNRDLVLYQPLASCVRLLRWRITRRKKKLTGTEGHSRVTSARCASQSHTFSVRCADKSVGSWVPCPYPDHVNWNG